MQGKMNTIQISYHKTKIGELVYGSFQEAVCLLDFRYRKMRKTVDDRIKVALLADFEEKESPVISLAKIQVEEYLQKKREQFQLPVKLVGSNFQLAVWRELQKINYGQTISYLQLARRLNNEKAVRAVAGANGANALALVVPCHRIIGTSGELVGYGGGLNVKQRLLSLERPDLFGVGI